MHPQIVKVWALLLWVLAGTAACGAGPRLQSSPQVGRSAIDTNAMRAYTYFLSQDALRGRRTGKPGADIAAAYIVSACRLLGLEPIGGSGYYQSIPLVATAIKPGARLEVIARSWRRRFDSPVHFLPELTPPEALHDVEGRVVIVGTPIDPAHLPDVRGAIVAFEGPLGERGLTDTLRARGAVGLLQVVPDPATYRLYQRSRGAMRLGPAPDGAPPSLLRDLPWMLVDSAVAAAVLDGFREGGPEAPPQVSVHLAVDRNPVTARNVGCLLQGEDPNRRDSAIVLTAHYDHLGVGVPDESGDSIYNGFSDNAAGVAMVLANAEAWVTSRTRPRHSLLFLFFAGEEEGLLGSDYYVAQPLWPLSRTLGVINLDAGAPAALPASWHIATAGPPNLSRLAIDVALARGWSATSSPARPNSDHYPFGSSGVPAVLLIPGPGPYEGLSTDSSEALRHRWNHYHEASDEWDPAFPFRGLRRYAGYAYDIVRALDRGGAGARRQLR